MTNSGTRPLYKTDSKVSYMTSSGTRPLYKTDSKVSYMTTSRTRPLYKTDSKVSYMTNSGTRPLYKTGSKVSCMTTCGTRRCSPCGLLGVRLGSPVLAVADVMKRQFRGGCRFQSRSLISFLPMSRLHHTQWTVFPITCLLYTSPSPRDKPRSRMPSSA